MTAQPRSRHPMRGPALRQRRRPRRLRSRRQPGMEPMGPRTRPGPGAGHRDGARPPPADTVALPVTDPDEGPAALAEIDRLEVEAAATTTALGGAGTLLESLSRDRWAVVTSGVTVLARARLAAAGLPAPPVLITADDVSQGKPAPDGYRTAAANLGVDPARTVVFEDSTAGAQAGAAAGATVIGVGQRGLGTGASLVVRDLRGGCVARRPPQPCRRGPAEALNTSTSRTQPARRAAGAACGGPVRPAPREGGTGGPPEEPYPICGPVRGRWVVAWMRGLSQCSDHGSHRRPPAGDGCEPLPRHRA
ncbi:HAD superfamily hydrolase (TIGR01509 family) [Streptomyces sp. V4I23]|uniref:HAD-IA family hydrolase n=1 Tax=Streptomyces sp. V4I23 TaxID=3042282 RepID=UPI0027827383|nr:HAD superfamily hydrolase (TIGR01509 family) [Streptomyces sp. V4I23]